jgi:hypothetical protein
MPVRRRLCRTPAEASAFERLRLGTVSGTDIVATAVGMSEKSPKDRVINPGRSQGST